MSRVAVRQALDESIDAAADRIKLDALLLQSGTISLPEWQLRMEANLKAIHVMSTAAAVGGWAQATAADWSVAGNRIKAQYGFLDRFARQIENGLPLDARSLARAASYADAGSGTYEAVLRRRDLATRRVLRERRYLHSSRPCVSCVEYEAMGWQPPGVLPPIGVNCECGYHCRCSFVREFAEVGSSPAEVAAQRKARPIGPRASKRSTPGIAAKPPTRPAVASPPAEPLPAPMFAPTPTPGVPAAVAAPPKPPKPKPPTPAAPKAAPAPTPLIAPTPERRAQAAYIATEQAAALPELAKAAGMTPKAYTATLGKRFAEAVKGGELYLRISPFDLPKVLDAGRFKSQFETGTSGGALDLTERTRVESAALGVATDTAPERRPIYGYVSAPGFASVGTREEQRLDTYGQAAVRLKPGVRERATVTGSDTLTYHDMLVASPATAPSVESLPLASRFWKAQAGADLAAAKSGPAFLSAVQRNYGYVEAQYHGGLSVSDIAEVAFPWQPSAEVQAQLQASGIPWRVIQRGP